MTTLGGLGHTMPYLIRDFHLATTIALVVVAVELAVIAWIRKRNTPLLSAGSRGWRARFSGRLAQRSGLRGLIAEAFGPSNTACGPPPTKSAIQVR